MMMMMARKCYTTFSESKIGAFNKFPNFFVQPFKIVEDS